MRRWEESFEDMNFGVGGGSGIDRYTSNTVQTYSIIAATQTYGDGSYCCQIGANTRFINNLGTAMADSYVAFFCYCSSWSSISLLGYEAHTCPFMWYKGTTPLFGLGFGSNGKIRVYLGTEWTTHVAEGSVILSNNRQYHLEVRYNIADSGNIQIWVDGVLDINFSGDTKPGSDADYDTFRFQNPNTAMTLIVDSIVVNDTSGGEDNGRIGVYHLWSTRPAANSATNNAWAKSSGSNGATLLRDRPADLDATYIYSVVNGEKQGFTFDAITFPDNTVVHEVIDIHVPRKVTEGQIKTGMVGGTPTTEAKTAALDIGTSYSAAPARYRRTTDPHGDAWTTSSANACESLIESVIA